MKNLWYRLESPLSSRKLALTLFLLLLAICFFSTIVPQESALPPIEFAAWKEKGGINTLLIRAGLTRIFSTWYFLALTLLLFLSTLAATLRRARALLKGRDLPVLTENSFRNLRHKTRVTPALSFGEIKGALGGFAWNEGRGDDGTYLHGIRHPWARWSTVWLHGALLLLLLGVFVSQATYFRGYVRLGVGQDATLGVNPYLQSDGGIFSSSPRGIGIKLRAFDNSYKERGYSPDIASTLLLWGSGEGVREARLLRTESASYGGVDIYQSVRTGFAPLMSKEDARGGKESAYLFMEFPGKEKRHPAVDAQTPGTDMSIHAEFLAATVSYRDIREIKDPALQLTFSRKGAALYQAVLKPGEAVMVEGSRYTFRKIDYWSDFAITRDPGIYLVYAGFAAVALALFLLTFFTTVEVYALNSGERGDILVGVRSDRFQAPAERLFEKLMQRVC